MAEEIGLVDKLDEWVLRKACLRRGDVAQDDVKVAVNLSAVHFQATSRSSRRSSDALCAAALPPHRLEIEITETAAAAESSS